MPKVIPKARKHHDSSRGQEPIERARAPALASAQGTQLAQPVTFIGSNSAMAAQRELADLTHSSPQAAGQRKLADLMHNSPRQAAQRAMLEGVRERIEPQSNSTGLPDHLKSGIERMSGMAMDKVRVHYNSSKPAQLRAHAYAQGMQIHLAPGQERHLPHEAWHVVQQAQGRVHPTLQMQQDGMGVSLNDDAGLEREADVMGARASALGATPAPQDLAADEGGAAPLGAGAPVQLAAHIVTAPVVPRGTQAPSFAYICEHGLNNTGLMVEIDWPRHAQAIYDLIGVARPSLEDDADLTELARLEAETDELVIAANMHVATFDATDRWGRVAIADTLHADVTALLNLLAEVQDRYTVSEGGFSAKGRATAIDGVTVSAAHQGTPGADNSFINDIELDGATLSDAVGVAKPATAANAGANSLYVNGVQRASARSLAGRGQLLTDFNDAMARPNETQTANRVNNFATVDRNGGQQANMNGTNARGYAWITNTPGWNTTQWEWLHIRGASLGGTTGPTNLVLGTRDSNTHMMPFESHLKTLAKAAREHDYYDDLDVTWSLNTETNPHKWQRVTITWTLNKNDDAPDEAHEPTGEANFSPLATGSVLSKVEVQYLEDALREARPVELMDEDEGEDEGEDESEGDVELMDEGDGQ
jgi:hypothetical protein